MHITYEGTAKDNTQISRTRQYVEVDKKLLKRLFRHLEWEVHRQQSCAVGPCCSPGRNRFWKKTSADLELRSLVFNFMLFTPNDENKFMIWNLEILFSVTIKCDVSMQPAYMFYQICTSNKLKINHIYFIHYKNACTFMRTNLEIAWKVESAQSNF